MNFTPMKDKNIHIAHSQYHGCWWPGGIRSQGISSNGIDLVFAEYSSLNTKRFHIPRHDDVPTVQWLDSLSQEL